MRRLARLKALSAQPALSPDELAQNEELRQQLLAAVPFVVVAAVLWLLNYIVNPVNDKVPRGRMPSLEEWLRDGLPENRDPRDRPPGNYGGRAPPRGGRRRPERLKEVSLQPVTSVLELWETYTFSTSQIVEEVPSMLLERNYLVCLILQAASFPRVYGDWETYEGCAVQEVSLGPEQTVLGPVGEVGSFPRQEQRGSFDSAGTAAMGREVVLECGKMVDSYGFSLVAREERGSLVGATTVRVKKLPEDCHIDYEDDSGAPSIVCTVNSEAVYESSGLEGVAYIESIAVARPWRGSGLAGKLLSFMEQKSSAWGLRLVGLHVHRDNWSALKFYQRKGFEISSDWLGWGDGFFLLLKPIAPEPAAPLVSLSSSPAPRGQGEAG